MTAGTAPLQVSSTLNIQRTIMTFLDNSNYLEEVEKLFLNSESLDIAVAFFGKDAFPLLANSMNKEIRIVCNLESGACNPFLIEEAQGLKNIKIRTNNKLHAKTLIQHNQTIIGSANISANGLSFEGIETIGWLETGISTTDDQIITSAKNWYEELWSKSSEIKFNELEKHKKLWKFKRNNRSLNALNKSILTAVKDSPHEFIDRAIYFAIYRDDEPSKEALETFKKVKEHHLKLADEIDFYEGWNDLPDDAYLISVHVGPRYGVNIDGIYETPKNPLIEKFNTGNNESNTIKICYKVNDIYGFRLTAQDKKIIKANIKNLFSCEQAIEGEAFLIPITEAITKLKNLI